VMIGDIPMQENLQNHETHCVHIDWWTRIYLQDY